MALAFKQTTVATVEADWSRGFIRDVGRASIPPGGVYDGADYLFDRPGVARKRGGTAYQSNALGATTTGVNFVAAPEYPTGTKIVGLGADGKLYDATAGTVVDAGTFGITTIDNPELYVDKLLVTSGDGTTAPKKVYVSAGNLAFAAWGGSPPAGKYATVHLSRPVLGCSSAYPNRAWWGPVPDPETTWDTTDAYTDFNHNLTGLASIQGVMLGFSGGFTERIVGSTPPGTAGENLSLQPVGPVGCADARSIQPWGNFVVFASQDGVYVTDGFRFDSLTEKDDGSGILSYWRDQYATVAANTGTIAAGVYGRNYYIVTLSHGSTLVDTLVCYLPRKAWARATNIACRSFASSPVGSDELYGATISGAPGNRLLKLAGCFTPAAANKNDADGTAVAGSLQFRMTGQGVGLKAYGDAHLTYDMRDAASDNPTLAVSVATGIQADSGFTAVAESPLAETTVTARKRFTVSKDAQAVNVKLVQSGASSKTEIYLLEVEQRLYPVQSDGS